MHNLPAKVLVIAIIGGGFMLTGDLGWLANRGMRVLDAADVAIPSAAADQPPARPPATPAMPAPPPAAAARPTPAPPESPVPVTAPPADNSRTAASLAAADFRAPAGGPDQVAWTTLRAGDRVVLWLAGQGPRCLVLDVVDPAAGEALAYEAATVAADGLPLAAAGPPGRVVIGRFSGRQTATGIVRGGMIHLAPAGIASSGGEGRWLGPVEAIRLVP
jgi:hypothetical protein